MDGQKRCEESKMNYFVHYVLDSTPLIKTFKTKKAAKEWMSKFEEDKVNGDWIDFLVKGSIIESDEYYEEQIKAAKKSNRKS